MKVAFPVLLTSAIALGSRAESLLQVAGGTVRSVVYGLIGTALAQAILQGFGLWLAGVPAALFLGFVTFFLSFIPGGHPSSGCQERAGCFTRAPSAGASSSPSGASSW